MQNSDFHYSGDLLASALLATNYNHLELYSGTAVTATTVFQAQNAVVKAAKLIDQLKEVFEDKTEEFELGKQRLDHDVRWLESYQTSELKSQLIEFVKLRGLASREVVNKWQDFIAKL